MSSLDLTKHKVIVAQDVEDAVKAGAAELLVRDGAIFTPSAQDAVSAHGLTLVTGATTPGTGSTVASAQWDELFHSPAAEAIKAEIVNIGRKLWQRMYVDGNGGNISYRLTPDAVLCTPTLVSKSDLRPEDLCLVDLAGNQLTGGLPRTSEILMHLEIYKAVPAAKAVVHCHPPHATAYAITGRVPPTCIIPEFEVFIGKVGLTKYETPGTQKFAETVLPFAKDHNTMLLGNHGIVCWADTVTHAEWYAEVLDTYCWTLLIASQLGAPITTISAEKAADLLAIKQRLGLPDARLQSGTCPVCDLPEPGSIIAVPLQPACTTGAPPNSEMESLVRDVTAAVLQALDEKSAKK
jgi:L-fuculose-phosphate aldolase